ncbi:MAG TPA: hypothetical protein VGX28_05975 [Frankiaceae bacterium]|jgi:uncharacterized membrane protein YczE|nr:hypothetical protein [Frankiaceae bacterium]
MTRRVVQLFFGLFLAAFGIVLTLRSGLGVSPWDVLHGGVAERTGTSFGTVVQLVGAVVLAASLLLGVRPGFGTISNLVLIGVFENVLLDLGLGETSHGALVARLALFAVGTLLIGVAAALYIGAHFGAGPRDGLMVALHTRFGWSIGWARTLVEASALVAGIAMGGPVGVGTALYTVSIGPATQASFRILRMTPVKETTTEPI